MYTFENCIEIHYDQENIQYLNKQTPEEIDS